MFEYDEDSCNAALVLDRYNLESSLEYCRKHGYLSLYEIEEVLKEQHGYKVESALEHFSEDEFMEYLRNRYNVRFSEIITYKMI